MKNIESMLFPEIAADIEALALVPSPLESRWMIMANDSDKSAGWRIPSVLHGTMFLSRDAAIKAAANLSKCWRHRVIIMIPGD